MVSVVGETPTTSKLPPKPSPRKGKGLMVGEGPVTKKPSVLLREDSQYALKKISSIIKDKDCEDLGNHATEAIRETSLFSLAQVYIRPFSFIHLVVFFLTNKFFWILVGVGYDERFDWTTMFPMRRCWAVWERRLRQGRRSFESWWLGRRSRLTSLTWQRSCWRSQRRKYRHWKKYLKIRKVRSRRQKVNSVRLRRTRYKSITTPTPFWRSLVSSLPTILTIDSVRSKSLSLIWTFHRSLLTPRLKLQPNPSTPKEPTNFLLKKPISTLKVMLTPHFANCI